MPGSRVAGAGTGLAVLHEFGHRTPPEVVETVAQEWDSPDESQHVLAMRTANPDFVLSFSWPAPVATPATARSSATT
ncbi:MAG TPA: hypothetical protein VKO35_06150 [Acidimicrobiia bacterium]|nr:hypothetical protein [Acidimicrobiia bacterium]